MKSIQIFKGEFNARIMNLRFGDTDIITPAYIPSLSSRHTPGFEPLFELLWPDIPLNMTLVSGFDAKSDIVSDAVSKGARGTRKLYLDTGSFEKKTCQTTDEERRDYLSIVHRISPDIVAIPDCTPQEDMDSSIDNQLTEMKRFTDNLKVPSALTLLFRMDGRWIAELALGRLVDAPAFKSMPPNVVGVIEEELGTSVLNRINALQALRNKLDGNGLRNVLIHVFGCSEPVSMALYSVAGADLFDGTGWYRYAYRNDGLSRGDLSCLPLLECDCAYCKDVNWRNIDRTEYLQRLALHDLCTIESYFKELRSRFMSSSVDAWLSRTSLRVVKKVLKDA